MPDNATPNDFNSLAAKLDGLDLTEGEQEILDMILERAASLDEDDVSGFGKVIVKVDVPFKVEIEGVTAKRLATSLGWTGLSGGGQFMAGDYGATDQ